MDKKTEGHKVITISGTDIVFYGYEQSDHDKYCTYLIVNAATNSVFHGPPTNHFRRPYEKLRRLRLVKLEYDEEKNRYITLTKLGKKALLGTIIKAKLIGHPWAFTIGYKRIMEELQK